MAIAVMLAACIPLSLYVQELAERSKTARFEMETGRRTPQQAQRCSTACLAAVRLAKATAPFPGYVMKKQASAARAVVDEQCAVPDMTARDLAAPKSAVDGGRSDNHRDLGGLVYDMGVADAGGSEAARGG